MGQANEELEAHCEALARREQFLRALDPTDWPDGEARVRHDSPHDARRGDDPSAEVSAEDGTETMSIVIDAVHHRA
jgi:hypothetical protein